MISVPLSYNRIMKLSNPERYTFLMHLWREPEITLDRSAARESLVQVTHLSGGQEYYFAALEDMVDYLRSHWLRQAQDSSRQTR